ncbi:MAG: hypothetical protein IJ128_03865 [Firmicutes bacterium]|nr:hypothetical protein [Bacillota bacterium]
MFKFAYLINMPGYTPETYGDVYENEESYSIIAGVDGAEGAKAFVRKLEKDGYDLINLCSDFDEQASEEIRRSMGVPVEVQNAKYFPEEFKKLEALTDPVNYGVIIQMDGVEESVRISLDSPDCNTRAIFVKDMDRAKEAIRILVDEGIHFVELCGWFEADMTREMIAAAGGSIPVGSCGL